MTAARIEKIRIEANGLRSRLKDLERERHALECEKLGLAIGDLIEDTSKWHRNKGRRGIVSRIEPEHRWAYARVLKKDGTPGREVCFYSDWRKVEAGAPCSGASRPG